MNFSSLKYESKQPIFQFGEFGDIEISSDYELIFVGTTDIKKFPVLVYVTDGEEVYGFELSDFAYSDQMGLLSEDDALTIQTRNQCANTIMELEKTGKAILPNNTVLNA